MKTILLTALLLMLVTLPSVTFAQDEGTPAAPPVIVDEPPVQTPDQAASDWFDYAIKTWFAAALAITATLSAFKTAFYAPLRNNVAFLRVQFYDEWSLYQVTLLLAVPILAWLGFEADYVNVFSNTPLPYLADAPHLFHAVLSVAGISAISVAYHEIFSKIVA